MQTVAHIPLQLHRIPSRNQPQRQPAGQAGNRAVINHGTTLEHAEMAMPLTSVRLLHPPYPGKEPALFQSPLNTILHGSLIKPPRRSKIVQILHRKRHLLHRLKPSLDDSSPLSDTGTTPGVRPLTVPAGIKRHATAQKQPSRCTAQPEQPRYTLSILAHITHCPTRSAPIIPCKYPPVKYSDTLPAPTRKSTVHP